MENTNITELSLEEFEVVVIKQMKRLPTKIIVRHLPPRLTEEDFKEMCSPIPAYDYLRFCGPDPSLGSYDFCRAYINFRDPQSVFEFRERFTDYVFVDCEGNEANAIVEYAVFQGTPNSAPEDKKDKRQGTLEEDAEYQAYLASIIQEESTFTAPDAQPHKPTSATTTPWEISLIAIEKREAQAKFEGETPLTTFLNQRIEKIRKRALDDMKSSSSVTKRSAKAMRRKAKQKQTGDTMSTVASGGGGLQRSAVNEKPSHGRRVRHAAAKQQRDSPEASSIGLSSSAPHGQSQPPPPLPPSAAKNTRGGGGGRRGAGRGRGGGSHHGDGPPSYSSRHAANSAAAAAVAAAFEDIPIETGHPARGGGGRARGVLGGGRGGGGFTSSRGNRGSSSSVVGFNR